MTRDTLRDPQPASYLNNSWIHSGASAAIAIAQKFQDTGSLRDLASEMIHLFENYDRALIEANQRLTKDLICLRSRIIIEPIIFEKPEVPS